MTGAEREQFKFEIEERAAIREFDGGETRQQAERNARIEVVEEWVRRRGRKKPAGTSQFGGIAPN